MKGLCDSCVVDGCDHVQWVIRIENNSVFDIAEIEIEVKTCINYQEEHDDTQVQVAVQVT